MHTSVFIATSLDGFIARETGAIDWLPGSVGVEPDEDYGYQAFFESVDAIAMGRHTYELVRSFEDWPYGDRRVFVLSHHPVDIPPARAATVERLQGTPATVLATLAARGHHHLYVDGGKTIQGFLQADLIDELTIAIVPILLGSGIPLFGPVPHDQRWQLLTSRSFPNGIVQNHYRRATSE